MTNAVAKVRGVTQQGIQIATGTPAQDERY
jgi:hypothetical protein